MKEARPASHSTKPAKKEAEPLLEKNEYKLKKTVEL